MTDYSKLNIIKIDSILVSELLKSPVMFSLLTKEQTLNNKIKSKILNRPQLALAGYKGYFDYNCVQIIGNTELLYLNTLSKKTKINRFKNLLSLASPAIIFSDALQPDEEFIKLANKNNVAVLACDLDYNRLVQFLIEFFDDQFTSQVVMHGSYLDVFGVGILFTGRSGIGKSEIALDLIERGHRLVADDVVMLSQKSDSILIGTGTSLVQHFMEIRGLGIIDIRHMFGVRSIRYQKRLEIIVELMDWKKGEEYQRVGLEEESSKIMGVSVSTVKLPIFPGKNITVIAETIAINYLLRTYGYNAAKELTNKIKSEMSANKSRILPSKEKRAVNWFRFDRE